jgi:SET domain-containing protein
LTGGTTATRPITEAARERTNKKAHLKQHYNIKILKEKLVKRDYLFLHMIAKFHSI